MQEETLPLVQISAKQRLFSEEQTGSAKLLRIHIRFLIGFTGVVTGCTADIVGMTLLLL
jgi:hypothetical protein